MRSGIGGRHGTLVAVAAMFVTILAPWQRATAAPIDDARRNFVEKAMSNAAERSDRLRKQFDVHVPQITWLGGGRAVWESHSPEHGRHWLLADADRQEATIAFREDAVRSALVEDGVITTESKAKIQVVTIAARENDALALWFLIAGQPTCWMTDGVSTTEADWTDIHDQLVPAARPTARSSSGGRRVMLSFVNATDEPHSIDWIAAGGETRRYATIPPGGVHRQSTFSGHVWRIVDKEGTQRCRVRTPAPDELRPVVITTDAPRAAKANGRNDTTPATRHPRVRIDGRTLTIGERQQAPVSVFFADSGRDVSSEEDGEEVFRGPVRWAPDGNAFVVRSVIPAVEREIPLVEVSPDKQTQPRLNMIRYRKPGDPMDQVRPRLFVRRNAGVGLKGGFTEVNLDATRFRDLWSLSRLRWNDEGTEVTMLLNHRGHQQMEVIAVDGDSGAIRTIVDERSDTFIDYSQKTFMQFVGGGESLIWMSERSGWNHLYLVDTQSGDTAPVTRGDWVVRSVEHVDEERGEIRLTVLGVHPDESPYHRHHATVKLDGSDFRVHTPAIDADHNVVLSPDRALMLDRVSRVDQPTATQLLTANGTMLAAFETTPDDDRTQREWSPPIRFHAPGRDDVTDIHGVIHRPVPFDPAKKYPVIEQIYAGPHGHHIPVAFRSSYRAASELAHMGFVVVQIDGMGTNWRSKAFHDVAHRNLADGGFPDRIAWMKAAARAYPWMDIERVGIYGGSAGGQNALAAMLHHADFYDAAAADCGCHDNRMDKIWWNEAWMGWSPEFAAAGQTDESDAADDTTAAYLASSNVVHAHKLRGPLLLTVGAMDRNVDPASTMQVVDALIDANRDFDLIVMPSAGHGAGGSDYGRRRRAEFFLRHLRPEFVPEP